MDDQNKKTPESSTDEQLDALLAKFLADPSDEIPTAVSTPEPEVTPGPQPWLDDRLDTPQQAPEIGPDEQAVAAAGLTHPEEAELEKIIQETKASDWTEATISMNPVAQEGFLDRETRDAFDEGKTLDEVFADEPTLAPQKAPQAAPPKSAPQKKAMPKKKNTYGLLGIPHLMSVAIWLVLAVAIGATVGRLIWVCATDVLAFGREDQSVTITITKDDDLDAVTEKLHKTGLIEYPGLFKLYAGLSNAMNKISAGTYELNTLYDYHALVLMMSSTSHRVTVQVTVPEGYTCKQIFELLEKKGVCTAAELEAAAAEGELGEYWFLEGVERGDKYCLEGYLFPDTYEFYMSDNPVRVINKFLTNFDYRFSEKMMGKLDTLNEMLATTLAARGFDQAYIEANKFTIRQVVIMASMIEKETAAVSESYKISSVIYNRLTNPGSFPYLNIDATLVYITGNTQLTQEDKELDTPYNTYLYKGLIPGPISNPGRSSLDAALDPENTDYYYYALDPETNTHHFSKTYAEHQAFLDSLKKEN